MNLWIFGHSVCLPYDLEPTQQGWPEILSNELGLTLKNYAQPAADNFYIYAAYQENKIHMTASDLVIIGWSHPARKSFVLDRQNPKHVETLKESLVYKLDRVELMRSLNSKSPAFSHWNKLLPTDTGKEFYDTWFRDYFNIYEQKLNLLSYHESIKSTCKGQYIPFFFSEESVDDLDLDGAGYILEFIIQNQVAISESNMHPNAHGHKLWADHIKSHLLS